MFSQWLFLVLLALGSSHFVNPKYIYENHKDSITEINWFGDSEEDGSFLIRKSKDVNDVSSNIKTDDKIPPEDDTSTVGKSFEPYSAESFIQDHSSQQNKIEEYSLRVNIPNPKRINMNNSDEIVQPVFKNFLIQEQLDNVTHHNHTKARKGEWRDGCLSRAMTFPTIDLQPNEIKKSFGDEIKEVIRINKYYRAKRDRFYVRNTGLGTISFQLEPDDPTSQATIRGENWKDEYVLAKGDVYWSLDNNHGAQHSINKQGFALEIQLVHYAKKHESLEAALTQNEGIIVMSLLYEAVGEDNPVMEPLAKAALSVGFPNKKWKQVHGPLDLMMLYPIDMSYYSYIGQYISEPCTSAKYFVMRKPMTVSYSQLQKFRELRDHKANRMPGAFSPLINYMKDTLVTERSITFSKANTVMTSVKDGALGKGASLKKLTEIRFLLFSSLFLLSQTC